MIHSVIVHQCGFFAHAMRRAMDKTKEDKKFSIGFIGCGRIGKAIVRYLLDSGEWGKGWVTEGPSSHLVTRNQVEVKRDINFSYVEQCKKDPDLNRNKKATWFIPAVAFCDWCVLALAMATCISGKIDPKCICIGARRPEMYREFVHQGVVCTEDLSVVSVMVPVFISPTPPNHPRNQPIN